MAEEKKPPKLAPKSSKPGSSTPAQPQKPSEQSTKASTMKTKPSSANGTSAPKKLPAKQTPAKGGQTAPKAKPASSASKGLSKGASTAAQKQPAKLNQGKAQSKPDEFAKGPSAASSKSSAQPSSNTTAKRPPIARSKPSTQSKSSGQSKVDGHPKRPSVSSSKSNTQSPRKSSLAPKPSSDAPGKRPSIAPRKSNAQVPKDATEKPKQAPRKPSLAPRKSSTQQQASKTKQPTKLETQKESDEDAPAHKVNDENRDLKDILSESQCADLTILIANITERMRQSIEKAFDAKSGLKLINQAKEGEDSFANIDYDPGTVDVGAYDKERKLQIEQEKELSKPHVQHLKTASLKWFDEWREVVIQRVGEVVNSKKTATDQKDQAASGETKEQPVPTQQRSQKINATGSSGEYAPPKLEDIFPRVRTPLTKLPMAQRVLVLHAVFLLLLSLEHYNAASRVLLLYLTSSLKIGLKSLREDEEQTAQGLLEAAKQMTADQEAGKKQAESQESRKWKIRLASAAGAAIIGYTGGMAAPMVAAGVGSVMGELGLGATTAAGYLGTVAGNTAIVGSLFGAYGGRMTGQIMSNISADVEDFAFLPVHGERKEHEESLEAATDKRRLRVVVAISGWLLEKEEVVSPWRVLKPSAEVFALRFELEALMNLGQSFDTMLSSAAYGYAQSALAKRTVFSELMSAMWPLALVKVARVVDNPFSVAKNRADKAGEVLAEALMNRAQGERPVTLIGYSLGARVIWSCLTTLAKKRGFGFVESAVMMGSPIPSDINTWRQMRTAVTGRLVNVYSENDYLLAFLYRSASLQYGVAGLMPVSGISGIENVDVSEMVSGHLRYRYLVGSILDKIRFEDVDKDEVAKEAKAFEAVVEEEKKNTYEKQLRDNAGNLYDQYGERLGLPKGGRKLLPQKEKEVSDEKADNEASKMEKQVHDKTQKGLMQWAAEQLYITPQSAPSTEDAKKAASDPKASTGKAVKDVKKTGDAATKSLYERAMEATYLSRSGGPKGEAAAKDKASQAKETSKSAAKGSYLSSAANYIPSGYLPSFGGSAKSTPAKAPKKLGDQPKRPSTLNKAQSKSRSSTPQLKKTESVQKKAGDASKDAQKKVGGGIKDAQQKASSTSKDAKKKADDVGKDAQTVTDDAGKKTKGTLDRISGNAQKAADDAAEDPVDAAKKGWNAAKQGKQQVDEFTKTADDAKKTAEGYTSYIPSFGMGGSKETPKDESKEAKQDSKTPSKKNGGDAKDSPYTQAQKNPPKEKPYDSSGYTSYIPSFGFGGPSSDKPPEDQGEKDDPDKEEADDKMPQGNKSDENPTESKDKAKLKDEANSKDNDTPKDGEIPKDDQKPKEGEPKKKYPWEIAMEEGKDVETTSANDPSKQKSSYTSYIPSLGFGGSSEDKSKKGQQQQPGLDKPEGKKVSYSEPAEDNPKSPPAGGYWSGKDYQSDVYPEDSISSPEKGRKRPGTKRQGSSKGWSRRARSLSTKGNKSEEGKGHKQEGAKDEKPEEGQKERDDPSEDQDKPEKKYPWEVAMEKGDDTDPAEQAKSLGLDPPGQEQSGIGSYVPSFGLGGSS